MAGVGDADPALDLAWPCYLLVEGHLPDGLVAAHRQAGVGSKSDTGT